METVALDRVLARRGHSWLTTGLLMLSDFTSIGVVWIAVVWGRYLLGGVFDPAIYWRLWPVLLVFLLVYRVLGLYPGVGLNPAEELRRTSAGTTLVYLLLGSTTFLVKEAETYSRAVFLAGWMLTLPTVPLSRAAVRQLFSQRPWWGYSLLILGAGQAGEAIAQALMRNTGLGLRPLAFLDDSLEGQVVAGLPVIGGLEAAPLVARQYKIHHALVAMPSAPREELLRVIERYGSAFSHLTLIPDLFGMASLWVTPIDIGGVLGLEVRNNLLRPWPRRLKRALDLTGVLIGGSVLLPFLAIIALLVRLDSPGPAFFGHDRLGQHGRRFRAWKFRTMVSNADRLLNQTLQASAETKAEWERDQKLKDDPRVTRLGRWLRRTSLDELPQLWNVLKGEMSLVGPRPIVESEVGRYSDRFDLYTQVLPGITGLWQVSGRNETSYQERVSLDAYYVRNWSLWLDLYLLARTVWAVMWGKGAY